MVKFNLFPKRLRDWQKESFVEDLESCDWVIKGSVRLNGMTATYQTVDGEESEAFAIRCNKCKSVSAHFGADAYASCKCGNFDEAPAG